MSIIEQFNNITEEQDRSHGDRRGITLATVTNINDPENLGRVKCKFFTANQEASELDWAYVLTPFGGKECGFYFMPNIGDAVLLAFEDGDVRRPFIIGSLWGSILTPPLKLKDGKNETYQIKTPNKSTIELLDTKEKEKITVKTPKGRQVVLDDEKKLIEIKDDGNSITLDGEGGEVKIKCKNKLTIEVGDNAKITIDGVSGAVKIEGKKSVDIEGAQINLTAKAKAAIAADGQISVESKGMAVVKGAMLKLN